MKNYFDMKGHVAIVTGCSGGLGVQMAKALANQGCNIVPIARRMEKLEEVAKELREEYGVEVLPIRCDVTNTEMCDDVVRQTMEHFGRIDILVNNAGIIKRIPMHEMKRAEFQQVIDIDLVGPCRRQAGYDSREVWSHHQHRFDVWTRGQQDCSVLALSCCQGWCCEPLARPGCRVG